VKFIDNDIIGGMLLPLNYVHFLSKKNYVHFNGSIGRHSNQYSIDPKRKESRKPNNMKQNDLSSKLGC
jgi:hypothetical protein